MLKPEALEIFVFSLQSSVAVMFFSYSEAFQIAAGMKPVMASLSHKPNPRTVDSERSAQTPAETETDTLMPRASTDFPILTEPCYAFLYFS